MVGDSELPFGSHFPTLDSKKGDETLRTPVYKTAKMSVETGLARISAAPGNSLNKTNSGGSSAVGFPGSKNQGLEAGASDLGQARFTTEVSFGCWCFAV